MGITGTLRTLLDGRYPEIRDRVRWWLSQPGNAPIDDLGTEEHRARVLAWARELSSEGDTAIGYPVEYGGTGSPGMSVTAFETLAMGDLSLLVKCGVQFGLFGGAILHLGTGIGLFARPIPGQLELTSTEALPRGAVQHRYAVKTPSR